MRFFVFELMKLQIGECLLRNNSDSVSDCDECGISWADGVVNIHLLLCPYWTLSTFISSTTIESTEMNIGCREIILDHIFQMVYVCQYTTAHTWYRPWFVHSWPFSIRKFKILINILKEYSFSSNIHFASSKLIVYFWR